jgi:hypothetical protein
MQLSCLAGALARETMGLTVGFGIGRLPEDQMPVNLVPAPRFLTDVAGVIFGCCLGHAVFSYFSPRGNGSAPPQGNGSALSNHILRSRFDHISAERASVP